MLIQNPKKSENTLRQEEIKVEYLGTTDDMGLGMNIIYLKPPLVGELEFGSFDLWEDKSEFFEDVSAGSKALGMLFGGSSTPLNLNKINAFSARRVKEILGKPLSVKIEEKEYNLRWNYNTPIYIYKSLDREVDLVRDNKIEAFVSFSGRETGCSPSAFEIYTKLSVDKKIESKTYPYIIEANLLQIVDYSEKRNKLMMYTYSFDYEFQKIESATSVMIDAHHSGDELVKELYLGKAMLIDDNGEYDNSRSFPIVKYGASSWKYLEGWENIRAYSK